jgi:hypothetical protein
VLVYLILITRMICGRKVEVSYYVGSFHSHVDTRMLMTRNFRQTEPLLPLLLAGHVDSLARFYSASIQHRQVGPIVNRP